jgi:hypothetical protein
MRNLIVLALVVVSVSVSGCTKVYNQRDREATIIAPTPVQSDTIEFRVLGNVSVPVTIRHSNSLDGTTLVAGVSLPYYAAIQNDKSSVFLLLEATAPSAVAPAAGAALPVVQVQIFVNGRIFREAYSTGAAATAQATGTFRR